jgi:WD40 repeat protein
MLALGLDFGRVMLVDEATGDVKWEVRAHTGEDWCAVAMSPSGRFVASVGFDDTHWTLLDAVSGAVHRVGARHDGTGACICEEGHQLLHACPVVAHNAGLNTFALSPCGQRLATGGRDNAVILWDAQTGDAEQRMQGAWGVGAILSLSFSADGARVASAGYEGSIRVWDTTGALLRLIPGAHEGYALRVHFSPRDNRLLASLGANQIHVWDVDSGEKKRSFAGRTFAVFSPDGSTIATRSAGIGRDVLLLDPESGAERVRMVGHGDFVNSASWSLDGSKIASGSSDYTCKVWDSSTGALLSTIEVGRVVDSLAWGRDWVRDTQRGEAFAMGYHPRLGAGSQVLELELGVVRMILDRV